MQSALGIAPVLALALGGCMSGAPVATIPAPQGYRLVWNDEFDGSGLPHAAHWSFRTGQNRIGWGKDEKQYYSAGRLKNSRVENGVLVIEVHRDGGAMRDQPDYGGQAYTSARLQNPEGLGWRYGYLEVRAKLPCGRGTWPAIWLMPAKRGTPWPLSGEIDVMEHVGFAPGVLNATVHTSAFNHRLKTNKSARLDLPDVCTSFHTYQMRWTRDLIEIGVDGNYYYRFANNGSGRQYRWPFEKPFGIILNIAVGGQWGGQRGIDDVALPQRMEIDFVRVFQTAAD